MYSYAEAKLLNERYMDGLISSIDSPGFRLRAKNKRYLVGLFAIARRALNLKYEMRKSLLSELNFLVRHRSRNPDTAARVSHIRGLVGAVDDAITNVGGLFMCIGGAAQEHMDADELLDFLGAVNRHRLPERPTALQVWMAYCTQDGIGQCVRDYVFGVARKLGTNDHLSEFSALRMESEVLGKLPAAPWAEAEWKMALSNVVCKIRRDARKADETCDVLWADKWRAERKMRKLEGGEQTPWTARAVAKRSLAVQAYKEPIERAGDALRVKAERMIALAPHLDAAFSLDELFDLFNTNAMERVNIAAELDGKSDTVKLLSVYSGENSATTRGQDTKSGIGGEMMTCIFMKLHASERGREMLREGFDKFFGDLPIRKGYIQPDGTFELAPPELEVIEGGRGGYDEDDLSPNRVLH